jgi:aryl-alcohol dehydrogenase-like predicted oxidoreductase
MNPESERTFQRTRLGRTGREVARLGLAASFGVPTAAVEKAIDAGVNYLYWGSMRKDAFGQALRNQRARRDEFVVLLQSYSRFAGLIPWSVERGLRELGYDHADVLLLGMWNKMPPARIVDACRKLKERGLVRHLAFSTHNRPLIPRVSADPDFDLFHVRYNAVHTGAERDIFPHLAAENRPGIVSFTATDWKRLLGHRRIPKGERVPTAGDCYRFVLSNPEVDLVLCGPATAAQMDHALEAFHKGPLDADEMAWMRRVGKAIYGK